MRPGPPPGRDSRQGRERVCASPCDTSLWVDGMRADPVAPAASHPRSGGVRVQSRRSGGRHDARTQPRSTRDDGGDRSSPRGAGDARHQPCGHGHDREAVPGLLPLRRRRLDHGAPDPGGVPALGDVQRARRGEPRASSAGSSRRSPSARTSPRLGREEARRLLVRVHGREGGRGRRAPSRSSRSSKRIAAIKSAADLQAEVARLQSQGVRVLFGLGSEQDRKNSEEVIAGLRQGGLGLPDRDYYLNDDARSKEIREKYAAHVAAMLRPAGRRRRAGEEPRPRRCSRSRPSSPRSR